MKVVSAQQPELSSMEIGSITKFNIVVGLLGAMMHRIQATNELDEYLTKARTPKQQLLSHLQTILNCLNTFIQALKQNTANHLALQLIASKLHSFTSYINVDTLTPKDFTAQVLEVECKLFTCLRFILGVHESKDQYTYIDRQPKAEFWKDVTIVDAARPQAVFEDYAKIRKMLFVTTAAVINQANSSNSLMKKLSFGMTYPAYIFDDEGARIKSMRFYRKPDIVTAQMLWNLPENGAIRQLSKVQFDSIEVNEKLYIPLKQQSTGVPDIHTPAPDTIQVRLLSSLPLRFTLKSRGSILSSCCGAQQLAEPFTTLIIHMHGGGFIAMSSRSMQVYTRKWAKAHHVPVLSIDYRMPPEQPFPVGLQDCLSVYRFAVTKLKSYVNIDPKRIIIAGDSAGGNLALSLTALTIMEGLPRPIGVFAAYPATDLRDLFSPSRLNALSDPLLWPTVLMLCLEQYLQNDVSNANSPMASPILLTEEYVNKKIGDMTFPSNWPPTFFTVGMMDPLLDDTLKMMERMQKSGIKCWGRFYRHLSHGYLNTGFTIDECSRAITQTSQQLGKLIKGI